MRPIVDRAWAIFHHPATAPAVLLLLAIVHISLDRFPHWDESVFLSQTSGRDGAFAPPVPLGPSREIGSVWKVGFLSSLTAEYPNIRLLHIVLSVALLAAAAHALQRAVRIPQALTVMVLGTYWVTFAYLGQLLRFAPLAFVLLLAMARYLLLVARPSPGWREPVVVGLLFAVGLILGPFETTMVLVSTFAHWLVFGRPRETIRRMAITASVAVVAFLVPFVAETRARFGSLSARLDSLTGLDPVNTSELDGQLVRDYIHLLFVGPVSNPIESTGEVLTRSALWLAAALMAVGVYSVAVSVVRGWLRKVVDLHISYFAITVLAFMGFLAGFYSEMADRYFILPGSLLLLLGLSFLHRTARAVIHARLPASDHQRRAAKLATAIVALAAFAIPNVAVASQVDATWTHPKDPASVLALTRSAIGDQPCHGVAEFYTPSVQWATGCRVVRVDSLPEALQWAREADTDAPAFIYWATAAISSDVAEELDAMGWYPLLSYPDGQTPQHQVFIRP